jgi:hypothetical protein
MFNVIESSANDSWTLLLLLLLFDSILHPSAS